MHIFDSSPIHMPLLSLIIWLPMVSLWLLILLPVSQQHICRYLALGTTLLQGLIMARICGHGINNTPIEQLSWFRLDLGHAGILSVTYSVGIDGLNASFILLAILILTLGIVASWQVRQYVKAYFALYLLMDTLIMGTFLALDLLLFYIFFEVVLLPIYFLISIWGGAQRTQASTKFLLYNLFGTIMIFIVLIGLSTSVYDPVATGLHCKLFTHEMSGQAQIKTVQDYVQARLIAPQDIVHSLRITCMTDVHNFIPESIFAIQHGQCIWGKSARLIAYVSLLIGFLIKLAAVPLHSWLPDAHVEAPTPISMLLAALVLKVGGYGIMRIAYPIFPEGAIYYAFGMGILGVCTIIYAALLALSMQDLKRMVAYSSVANIGFVLLGLASLTYEGMHGALYQMISHGCIAALLFYLVGILQVRTQDRNITHYSGLATQVPYYTTLLIVSFFAALGLPGFSSFVAKLLVLVGALSSTHLPNWIGIASTMGILLNAIYWIWVMQRICFGNRSLYNPHWALTLHDLNTREYIVLIPLLLCTLILGVYPQCLLDFMADDISQLATYVCTVGKENLKIIHP